MKNAIRGKICLLKSYYRIIERYVEDTWLLTTSDSKNSNYAVYSRTAHSKKNRSAQ